MSLANHIKEDQIQDQILQSAKRLFSVHGLAKVTMDDVAKAIGKGRSSLYYYYKSKDEIFDAVMHMEINGMIEAMEKAAERVATLPEKINTLFVSKIQISRERGSFFSAMDAGMDADAIRIFQKTKITHHQLIIKREKALFNRVLTGGIATGELKPIKTTEMENLVFVMVSCLHGIKQELRTDDSGYDIEPVISQFTRTIMYGLLK